MLSSFSHCLQSWLRRVPLSAPDWSPACNVNMKPGTGGRVTVTMHSQKLVGLTTVPGPLNLATLTISFNPSCLSHFPNPARGMPGWVKIWLIAFFCSLTFRSFAYGRLFVQSSVDLYPGATESELITAATHWAHIYASQRSFHVNFHMLSCGDMFSQFPLSVFVIIQVTLLSASSSVCKHPRQSSNTQKISMQHSLYSPAVLSVSSLSHTYLLSHCVLQSRNWSFKNELLQKILQALYVLID